MSSPSNLHVITLPEALFGKVNAVYREKSGLDFVDSAEIFPEHTYRELGKTILTVLFPEEDAAEVDDTHPSHNTDPFGTATTQELLGQMLDGRLTPPVIVEPMVVLVRIVTQATMTNGLLGKPPEYTNAASFTVYPEIAR